MAAIELNGSNQSRHAALLQRAQPVAECLFAGCDIAVQDTSDHAMPSRSSRRVTLERGVRSTMRRESDRLVRVAYDDPDGETALAMLIAAMAGSRDPIAADPDSLSVFALAGRLAASTIPVLIGGPTGTGKEVLSRFIHARSDRSDGPFIAVNCAAMPEAMLEALLFGHQKGAFTGATQASEGFMRAADGGTLLLDEITEMPLGLQAKLLRALQESEVVPIGATRPVKLDVRIIACANRDLPVEVAEGRFRADLYYRLNVFPLTLRPLRERVEDIAPLAFAMVLRHTPAGRETPSIAPTALAMLKLHGWPGNVRELENVVRRALLLAGDGDIIEPAHIAFDSTARLLQTEAPAEAPMEPGGAGRLANIVQLSEARAIMETLDACGGNRVRAARELGISERTLRYRLASFRNAGIEIARRAAGGSR